MRTLASNARLRAKEVNVMASYSHKKKYVDDLLEEAAHGDLYISIEEEHSLSLPTGWCESDNVLFVISMREPISRIFARERWQQVNVTQNLDSCGTDNYALRKITGSGFKKTLTNEDLEAGKTILKLFDAIVLQDDIEGTLPLLCTGVEQKAMREGKLTQCPWGPPHVKQDKVAGFDIRTTLPPEILQRMTTKNAFDIALYEYSRELSHTQLRLEGLESLHVTGDGEGRARKGIEEEGSRSERDGDGPDAGERARMLVQMRTHTTRSDLPTANGDGRSKDVGDGSPRVLDKRSKHMETQKQKRWMCGETEFGNYDHNVRAAEDGGIWIPGDPRYAGRTEADENEQAVILGPR